MKSTMAGIQLALVVSYGLGSIETNAALITFSFTGAAGNEVTYAPDSQPPHLTVSSMSRGSGVNPSAREDTFSASSWTTSGSLDPDNYFRFIITPEAGFTMSLTQLLLDERRSGTGIRNWTVRSSLDGFASNLGLIDVPDNTGIRENQSILLPGPLFGNLTSALELRIYGYGAEAASGTWSIDNVEVNGSVLKTPTATASVPETLPFAAASCALLGTMFVGRKLGRPNRLIG